MGKSNLAMPEFEKLEHQRLTTEIFNDRNLQFKLFWQSITVTAIIFSFCASIFQTEFWFKFPFVILAPHLILIPTASIILNRARTANRKSGYLLVAFNKYSSDYNWERDLSILRQSPPTEGGESIPPHRTVTIKNMLISITALEIICVLVYFLFLFVKPINRHNRFWLEVAGIGLLYSVFYTSVLASRIRAYFCTRYEESIQGYATRWVEILHLDEKVLEKFGKWNDKAWAKELNNERNSGWMKYVYKIVWSQPAKDNMTWEFTPSYLKPVVFGLLFWVSMAVFINVSRINFPSFARRNKPIEIIIRRSSLDSLFANYLKRNQLATKADSLDITKK